MQNSTQKQFAYKALQAMRDKLDSYAKRPDANSFYIEKNNSYLSSIESYIKQMENAVLDSKFNADFLIVTDGTGDSRKVQRLQERVAELEAMLYSTGITATDQRYMRHDMKEIRRSNSISRAKQTGEELY